MNDTVRANASIECTNGNDGRDAGYYIRYNCPKCRRRIHKEEIACVNCKIFFDWTKKAHIKVVQSIEWS